MTHPAWPILYAPGMALPAHAVTPAPNQPIDYGVQLPPLPSLAEWMRGRPVNPTVTHLVIYDPKAG